MPSWPQELYLITHAECDPSAGDLHREAGLSARGHEQARTLGAWFGTHEPRAVWSSPFRCARETARVAIAVSGLHAPVIVDERLALGDASDVLHDAGSLADALRACAYTRLAIVTHRPVVIALSSIIERLPINTLLTRDRRECSITEYRREDGTIRRIA